MKEKLTPYLKEIMHPAVEAQYKKLIDDPAVNYTDPLMEDRHEVVKGLIHKYPNRALIKVSYQCAAHCRFCTRIRQIGQPEGTLQPTDIAKILHYLKSNPQIDDLILSGGDPLYTPQITYALLAELQTITSIKVLRIGSRLALQSPQSLYTPLVQKLLKLIDAIGEEKPFYILLHINHPSELTEKSIAAIRHLRRLNVTLLSQTVFLKGVNDSLEVMKELFTKIYHAGIQPYYLYHCDAVKGLENFQVPIKREIEIVGRLFRDLSGIAVPRHVIDVEAGYGKLPVPQKFVSPEGSVLKDFGATPLNKALPL